MYLDADGDRVSEQETIDRVKQLAIPPAWTEVWICTADNGHIQATGFDDAGRKQYLYHEQWSRNASSKKFDEMLEFSRVLPALRRVVAFDIATDEITRAAALACAVRLMDLGFFRIGSEEYADENRTFGVATIRKNHVSLVDDDGVRFEYSAKGSKKRIQDVYAHDVRIFAEKLLRRRSGPDDFLVYKDGRTWVDVKSSDINEYIQEHTDGRFSAKDFRTWNGTVLAAAILGMAEMPDTTRGREREIRDAIEQVAELLGNTPAVCRKSYVDPRVLDRFRDGIQIDVPAGWRIESAPRVRAVVEKRVRGLIENR